MSVQIIEAFEINSPPIESNASMRKEFFVYRLFQCFQNALDLLDVKVVFYFMMWGITGFISGQLFGFHIAHKNDESS